MCCRLSLAGSGVRGFGGGFLIFFFFFENVGRMGIPNRQDMCVRFCVFFYLCQKLLIITECIIYSSHLLSILQ